MDEGKEKKRQFRRGLWKLLIGLAILLVVTVTGVLLAIDPLALTLANRAMKHLFPAGGVLQEIDIRLNDAAVELNGLTINAPQGFGVDPLLTLGALRLDIDPLALADGEISVEQLTVRDLSVVLVRDKNGQLSPLALIPPSDETATEARADDTSENRDPPAIPPIRVDRLHLENISLRVQGVVEGASCKAGFERLDIRLADVTVGDISSKRVSLGSFNLDLKGGAVDQPPGYEKDKLASLSRLTIRTGRLDLASPVLVVNTVTVTEPAAAVIVGTDKVTNWEKMKAVLLGPSAVVDGKPQSPESGEDESESGVDLPVVRFDEIKVSEGSLYFRNNFVSKEGLELPLENAYLSISGLKLFDKDRTGAPAAIEAAFELLQPGTLPKALFGAEAVVGPVNTLPPLNAQARFVGLKLDTLGSMVPPATRTALGATGLDTSVAVAVNNHAINLFTGVLTDHDIEYNAIHVQGPLDKPSVQIADIFSGAILRVTDGLVNLGGDTLLAGASVVKGGVQTVGEVGAGVWEIGKNLGVSAFEVGKGAMTLDGEELKEGLAGATVDTVKITSDTAKDTGSAAGGGLGDSVSNLKGDHIVQKWDKGIPARYERAMQQAKEDLSKMPYPPVVED